MTAIRRFGELLVELGYVTDVQVQQALALQPLTGARMGEALLALGFLTRSQLQRALSRAVVRGESVLLDRPLLGEVLVGLQYVDEPTLRESLEEQARSGQRLGEVLVAQRQVTHQQLFEALGLQQRMGQPTDALPALASAQPGARLVVLVEAPGTRPALQGSLEACGWQVARFVDPFLALEQLDLLRPEVLLADLDLPGLPGLELCERVKQAPRSVPVVLLVPRADEASRGQVLRAGADDALVRGAPAEQLAASLEAVLRRLEDARRAREVLAAGTSPTQLQELLAGGPPSLHGQRHEVTVLQLSFRERPGGAPQPPRELTRALDEALTAAAGVVSSWRGFVSELGAGGLQALWGAPQVLEGHLEAGLWAASELLDAGRGGAFDLGAGLESGGAVCGAFGPGPSARYGAFGAPAQAAARLAAAAGSFELLVGPRAAAAPPLQGAFERLPWGPTPAEVFRATPALRTGLESRRLARARFRVEGG
jgi:adenylate cyclase